MKLDRRSVQGLVFQRQAALTTLENALFAMQPRMDEAISGLLELVPDAVLREHFREEGIVRNLLYFGQVNDKLYFDTAGICGKEQMRAKIEALILAWEHQVRVEVRTPEVHRIEICLYPA